jgi:hypothetical protein
MTIEEITTEFRGQSRYWKGGHINCSLGAPTKTGYPRKRLVVTKRDVIKRRKPEGWIPPTPYSYERTDAQYQEGEARYYHHGGSTNCNYGQTYRGLVGGTGGSWTRFSGENHFNLVCDPVALWNSKVPGLNAKALIGARNELKNSKVNLGVAFGERKQTARLLGDTAIRLAKSLRALKSGKIRRAMDELGITSRRREPRGSNVPKKWLELQYGWKPLLSEVYGAAEALNERPQGDWRVTVKATRKENIKYNTSHNGIDMFYGSCEGYIGSFVRIDALPSNLALIKLASLGVTNPLLVGWELVPFSFVVDWMLPIGGYLESLDALLGYSSSGTYASYSAFMKIKITDKGRSGQVTSVFSSDNNWIGTKEVVKLIRTTSSGVSFPSFPRIKDPLSLGHMANGLSLLAQVFGR